MTVTEIIRAKEREFRILRFEAAFAVDEIGNIVRLKSASLERPCELGSTTAEMNLLRSAMSVVFTHNHPRGWEYEEGDPRQRGSSFSPEDIHLACQMGFVEIRVVTPKLARIR
jgi:hypothetical protein